MSDIEMDVDPEAGMIKPVPEGQYLVACVGAFKQKSKKGLPQVVLSLVVDEGEFVGRKLGKTWVTFIPEGEPGHGMAVAALRAFGLLAKGEKHYSGDREDFKGRTAYADIGYSEDGKWNTVDRFVIQDEQDTPPAGTFKAATTATKTGTKSRI